MGLSERTESGKILQRVFEILIDFPEGLSIKELFSRLNPEPNQNGRAFYEWVMCSCIPPLKAGWLKSRGYYLSVSEEGRSAYEKFTDPHTFIKEAAKHSTRGWLSLHFPRPYYVSGKAKDRIVSEIRFVRRVGVKRLATQAIGKVPDWHKVLPVQSVRRIKLADNILGSGKSLVEHFHKDKSSHYEGGHAIYLPPKTFQASILAEVSVQYPRSAGLKIIKTPGDVDQAAYVNIVNKGDSKLHLNSIHGHKHLTLVANLLHAKGVGARLFDLVEIEYGQDIWTAYVIEHADDGAPSMEQCRAGVARLQQLDAAGLLRVSAPEGFDDDEFRCPGCEGNAFIKDGQFTYVDFQNFLLGDYAAFLKTTAVEATEASHFGDRSILRGGTYLYQTVPGVNLPAKRNIDDREQVLMRLLRTADVSVKDRVVFDVGCNIGMMMALYLKMGARWAHGWDRPYVAPHTEKVLLALGCTRFSTTGTDINDSYDLTKDIPSFLASRLEGCVVSYLAVREHLGWLKALQQIPWAFLIYEGHEGETREDFESYIKNFKQIVPVEVAAVEDYFDGDSESRTLAILRRL